MSDPSTAEQTVQRPPLSLVDTAGEKRRPGRAPGMPKVVGSGRRAGSRNHVSPRVRETVQDIIDKNGGRAFQRLFNIAFGLKIRVGDAAGPNPVYIIPSEASQMKALEILARKLRPDLSAVAVADITGQGKPPAEEQIDKRQVARVILSLLASGTHDGEEPFTGLGSSHVIGHDDATHDGHVLTPAQAARGPYPLQPQRARPSPSARQARHPADREPPRRP